MKKKKILFVAIPERGHINPLIGIAKCLHEMENINIAFFAQADISEQLKNANINCKCYTPKQNINIPDNFITHGADFAKKLKDKLWLQIWIKTLLIDSVPDQVNALEEVCHSFIPDLIVSDPMVYATSIVAEKEKPHGLVFQIH